MPKISDLPLATTPLSGDESLLLLQGTQNVKAGVGVSQVLQSYGALPTSAPLGQSIYAYDALGGASPAFWDGVTWRDYGTRSPVSTLAEGVWIFGGGNSNIPIFFDGAGVSVTGYGFFSLDGFNWQQTPDRLLNGYIENCSYADGAFVIAGKNNNGAAAITAAVPGPMAAAITFQRSAPYAYFETGTGRVASGATAYDVTTGIFTIFVDSGAPIEVTNPLTPAVTPNPDWPEIGAFPRTTPVPGVGTMGPVEVRVDTANILFQGQVYATDFISSRRIGVSDWTVTKQFLYPVNPARNLAGVTVPGVVFNGLVFGRPKATAVQFQPGSN